MMDRESEIETDIERYIHEQMWMQPGRGAFRQAFNGMLYKDIENPQ